MSLSEDSHHWIEALRGRVPELTSEKADELTSARMSVTPERYTA
jgi:hypothetical protein